MAAPTAAREYRVTLYEWDVWDVIVEAASEAEAIAQAAALYREHGTAAFIHHDCGDDGFAADPYDRECGR
ncbi:hypothetical protein [Prosthecodimorpha staleyi]|uniref:Uncharacterized protein n=1 Tax=Prosthecodimorpha staleyi TaxID=2840188 RepID=A0A947D8K5_9HYPH|nr:hypothetical protein [Prosthecodimorpha staleyi]MBT9293113.1 hypothetical protein [Prosthecodimorpha staleyi]